MEPIPSNFMDAVAARELIALNDQVAQLRARVDAPPAPPPAPAPSVRRAWEHAPGETSLWKLFRALEILDVADKDSDGVRVHALALKAEQKLDGVSPEDLSFENMGRYREAQAKLRRQQKRASLCVPAYEAYVQWNDEAFQLREWARDLEYRQEWKTADEEIRKAYAEMMRIRGRETYWLCGAFAFVVAVLVTCVLWETFAQEAAFVIGACGLALLAASGVGRVQRLFELEKTIAEKDKRIRDIRAQIAVMGDSACNERRLADLEACLRKHRLRAQPQMLLERADAYDAQRACFEKEHRLDFERG